MICKSWKDSRVIQIYLPVKQNKLLLKDTTLPHFHFVPCALSANLPTTHIWLPDQTWPVSLHATPQWMGKRVKNIGFVKSPKKVGALVLSLDLCFRQWLSLYTKEPSVPLALNSESTEREPWEVKAKKSMKRHLGGPFLRSGCPSFAVASCPPEDKWLFIFSTEPLFQRPTFLTYSPAFWPKEKVTLLGKWPWELCEHSTRVKELVCVCMCVCSCTWTQQGWSWKMTWLPSVSH